MKPGINTIADRHGRPMQVLSWSDGTRSAEQGEDLAGVAQGLTDTELVYWLERFRTVPGLEYRTLEAEIDCRGRELDAGPLFAR